ncbi:MAG TPA: DegT/DnrJ/EryC1/StrS family aminotransferase, partial [Longimicrobiales bacterium]|nr:DegT/DnrJ/EryC1/StrS family aminotransferase [Longimicrobiales bacterium]
MPNKRTLAAFGGEPLFAEPLHVGRPNLGDRDALMRRINDALDRRWLTNDGPLLRELEQRLAEYLEVEHCIAMCNATVALEVLARACALSGEVIVPGFTFIATAHAFAWL